MFGYLGAMCKFLMIDDGEVDMFIVDKMLDRYDLFSDKTYNLDAENAINKIESDIDDESKLPDVIFLDLMMPFSGQKFLERFSKLYPAIRKTIDIFVVTSSVNPASKLVGEPYSFVKGFFVKPLSRQTLTGVYSACVGEAVTAL